MEMLHLIQIKPEKLNKNENYYLRAYCTTKDGTRLYGWYWA